jgi:hypothetical protein
VALSVVAQLGSLGAVGDGAPLLQAELRPPRRRAVCWNRPSALLPINHRLFYRSTVGDEHLREDHEAIELESWFALRTTEQPFLFSCLAI